MNKTEPVPVPVPAACEPSDEDSLHRALAHYEVLADRCHDWSSVIPIAIRFYFAHKNDYPKAAARRTLKCWVRFDEYGNPFTAVDKNAFLESFKWLTDPVEVVIPEKEQAAMSDQLLPCPFCGRTASIQELKDNDLFYCSYCGCEGPRPYDIGICTPENCTTECVVKAWNTRWDSFKTEQP